MILTQERASRNPFGKLFPAANAIVLHIRNKTSYNEGSKGYPAKRGGQKWIWVIKSRPEDLN